MKSKHLFSILLVFLIILGICPVAKSEDTFGFTFELDKQTELSVGETVTVIVKLEQCAPIKSITLVPDYDAEKLQLTKVVWSTDIIQKRPIICEDSDTGSANPLLAFFKDTDINGHVLTMTFKILAEGADTKVGVGAIAKDIDADGQEFYVLGNAEKMYNSILDGKSWATISSKENESIPSPLDASVVSYQVTKGKNGRFSLRAIAGVNSLAYKNIGYEVSVTTKDTQNNKQIRSLNDTTQCVYTTINSDGEKISVKSALGYEYAAFITVAELALESIYTEISICAYVTTPDGEKVYGDGINVLYTGLLDSNEYPSFSVMSE